MGKDAAIEVMGEPIYNECAQGNPDKCVEKINRFLCSKEPKGRNCPRHVPNLFPPTEMHFAGLSNFAHVVPNMGLGGDPTLRVVRDRADAICGSGKKKKKERDEVLKSVAEKYRGGVCFDAFYVTQLANFGWDIPLEKVSPPDSRWADASWPLGAMIFEAVRSKNPEH